MDYLSAAGHLVFAAARKPGDSSGLQTLLADSERAQHVVVVPLDVTSDESIKAAVAAVERRTTYLDVVINNAAVGDFGDDINAVSRDSLLETFNVNAASPVLVARAFRPLLQASTYANKAVINISTIIASIEALPGFLATFLGAVGATVKTSGFAYAVSKAALNMANRLLSVELKDDGIAVVAVHPGWVDVAFRLPVARA